MAIEIKVPKLGLTMEDATLVEWKFGPGDKVKTEEIVLVLETDKVAYEMPSPGDGLLHPLAAAGEKILVSQIIGYLADDETELASLQSDSPAAAGGAPAAEAPAEEKKAAPAAAPAAPAAPADGRVKASPLAKAMAKENGLDLAAIPGTGPGGRVVKADVLKAMEQGVPAAPAAPAAAAAPAPAEGGLLTVDQELPISGVRKVVFKNMHASLQEQAQLTLFTEVSAVELLALRKKLKKTVGVKVSFNAIIVKAVAAALKQHPLVNASVVGDKITVWREIHVGLAIDLGQGLIVPKVRDAGTKSIVEIQTEIDGVIGLAKKGKLMPDDMAAGTFTVTNLGAWDIDHFTPIVNNPESAILGVGRIVDRPVAEDGQVVVRPCLALSLTIDHRIVDGAPGAACLKTIKDMLEQPLLML